MHCLNPACAFKDFFIIKSARVQNFVHIHIAEGGFNNLCLRLKRFYNGKHIFFNLGRNLVHLIKNNSGAIFDLLHKQIFDILFIHIFFKQRIACAEFICHSFGVHNGGDIVKISHCRQLNLRVGAVKHANGACNRAGLANA